MTAATSKTQAGPSSPRAGLPAIVPDTAEACGELLEKLMMQWARARHQLTKTYAAAYLGATGADGVRTQTAKQTAADDQLALDNARATLEGYRAMLNGLAKLGVPDGSDTEG
jgi:hypothetical protein